jgi:hypothetical protein
MGFIAKCNFIHNGRRAFTGQPFDGPDCEMLCAKGLLEKNDLLDLAMEVGPLMPESVSSVEAVVEVEKKPKKKSKKA